MGTTLDSLKPPAGARKKRRRVGRGPGSGSGKTCGRGQKGQKSRSGKDLLRGFEGGQMPLQRRLPKRGFTNIFRKEYAVVNVGELARRFSGEVDIEALKSVGLVARSSERVKVLGSGEIDKALTVRAHRFSASAREKIEKAGGKVEVLDSSKERSAAPKKRKEAVEQEEGGE